MEVYNHGSTVGLSISEPWILFLFLYLGLEIISVAVSRIPILYKVFLYFRVRREVKKVIPLWWRVKEISLLTMAYRSGHIECYVAVISKTTHLDGLSYKTRWTNDHIRIDWAGNILRSDLLESINRMDERVGIGENIKKQYGRDKALSELGIK